MSTLKEVPKTEDFITFLCLRGICMYIRIIVTLYIYCIMYMYSVKKCKYFDFTYIITCVQLLYTSKRMQRFCKSWCATI